MVDSSYEIDLTQFYDLYMEESQRHLLALNQGILALEQNPESEQIMYDVFRAAHTLKGMSATMGFDTVAELSHALEDVFHQIRVGNWALSSELIARTFTAIDTLETLVKTVTFDESTDQDITSILNLLQQYKPGNVLNSGDNQDTVGISDGLTSDNYDESKNTIVHAEPESELSSTKNEELSPVKPALYNNTQHLVSIDVKHLDSLLAVVSEMIIHRSYLMRLQQREELAGINEALNTQYQLLDRLQKEVLKTRMVPMRRVFSRFPRMVRDLLQEQQKDAQLIIEGETVEIDRTMLATLNDSLVHLIRNAIDHGLESTEDRHSKNKPGQGILRLSAYNLKNSVVIEISDDGRGMDTDIISTAAIERGIISQSELPDMTRGEVLDLLCSPGFSLNKEVTRISGRGVGLSAVKRQIELIRGKLEIETHLDKGSTFRIILPVSLALLNAVLVQLGDEVYAIPATQVDRIKEITPEGITQIGDNILFYDEEEVLPLKYPRNTIDEGVNIFDCHFAIVSRRYEQLIGICVNEIIGFEQIVAKPLPPVLQNTPGLSGVSILGEGQTVFILDLLNL